MQNLHEKSNSTKTMIVVKYTKERRNARETVAAFSSSSAKKLRTFYKRIALKCHFYCRDEAMRVLATKRETHKVHFDIDEGRSVAYQTFAFDRSNRFRRSLTCKKNGIHRCIGEGVVFFCDVGEANQCISRADKRITDMSYKRVTPVDLTAFIGASTVRHLVVPSLVNALTSANLRCMRVQCRVTIQ